MSNHLSIVIKANSICNSTDWNGICQSNNQFPLNKGILRWAAKFTEEDSITEHPSLCSCNSPLGTEFRVCKGVHNLPRMSTPNTVIFPNISSVGRMSGNSKLVYQKFPVGKYVTTLSGHFILCRTIVENCSSCSVAAQFVDKTSRKL